MSAMALQKKRMGSIEEPRPVIMVPEKCADIDFNTLPSAQGGLLVPNYLHIALKPFFEPLLILPILVPQNDRLKAGGPALFREDLYLLFSIFQRRLTDSSQAHTSLKVFK